LETVGTRPAGVWDLRQTPIPIAAAGLAFLLLFWEPITTVGRDWWNDPEAQHGLLLGPVALYLAWKKGLGEELNPQPVLGIWVKAARTFTPL